MRSSEEFKVEETPGVDGRSTAEAQARPSARQDLIAGMLSIAFGAFMLDRALTYPMGSPLRMGPGFFPTVLSALIIILGAGLALYGLKRQPAASMREFSIRPVVTIAAGIALFAVLIERFGVAPATIALVLVSSLAERRWRPARALIVAAAMTVAV